MLIDLQIAALQAAGIENPIVVIGTGGAEIAGRVGRHGTILALGPDLEAMGTRGTLIRGLRAAGSSDILILHGDILFHPGVLTDVLTSEEQCACLVRDGVEDGKPRAKTCDGRVVEVGERVSGDCTYMGIIRLSAAAAEDLWQWCHVKSRTDDYMVPLSETLRVHPCAPVPVGRYPAIDIDTQLDSIKAHRDVYPQVLEGLKLL